MFQDQNRKKTINSTSKVAGSFKIIYDNERDKTVFHNTTPDLQDQERFFGLRPVLSQDRRSQTTSLDINGQNIRNSDKREIKKEIYNIPQYGYGSSDDNNGIAQVHTRWNNLEVSGHRHHS